MSEQRTIPTLKCKRCGWEWIPRVPNPAVCPNCKHRDWDEDKPTEVKSDVEQ